MTLAKRRSERRWLACACAISGDVSTRKERGRIKPQHNHQNNHDFNLSPLAEGATNRAHLYQQDSRFDDRVESIINALMPLAPFLEGVTCETGTSSESPCEPSGHDELFVQQSPIDSAQPVQLNSKPTVQPLNPAADGAEVIVWSVGRETPASIAKTSAIAGKTPCRRTVSSSSKSIARDMSPGS